MEVIPSKMLSTSIFNWLIKSDYVVLRKEPKDSQKKVEEFFIEWKSFLKVTMYRDDIL
jgi:hypothetical protein